MQTLLSSKLGLAQQLGIASSPPSLGDALLPTSPQRCSSQHFHQDTQGWDLCASCGEVLSTNTSCSLSFSYEHNCSQFSSKAGKQEAPVTSHQAHLTSRH